MLGQVRRQCGGEKAAAIVFVQGFDDEIVKRKRAERGGELLDLENP